MKLDKIYFYFALLTFLITLSIVVLLWNKGIIKIELAGFEFFVTFFIVGFLLSISYFKDVLLIYRENLNYLLPKDDLLADTKSKVDRQKKISQARDSALILERLMPQS